MNYDSFLNRVMKQGRLHDENETQRATRATLEVLGRRLYGGEAKDLAAQLPPPIQYWMKPSETNDAFGPGEFVQLVADREGVNAKTAEFHVRAVLSVVSEAVSAGEMNDVWSQLSPDYAELLPAGEQVAP